MPKITNARFIYGEQIIGDYYRTYGVTLTLDDDTQHDLDTRQMGFEPMIARLRQLSELPRPSNVRQMMDAVIGKEWIDV